MKQLKPRQGFFSKDFSVMLCMNQDFVSKILKQHLLKQPLCGFQGLCRFSYQMNKKSVSPVGLSHAMFSDYLSTEVCHPVLLTREIETCESPPVLETQHPRPAGDIYYAPEARVLICNAKPCASMCHINTKTTLEHFGTSFPSFKIYTHHNNMAPCNSQQTFKPFTDTTDLSTAQKRVKSRPKSRLLIQSNRTSTRLRKLTCFTQAAGRGCEVPPTGAWFALATAILVILVMCSD